MQIVKRISKSGASVAQITDLERRIGATIPSDYRGFLLGENGGRPSPTDFEGPSGDGSVVHFFFTLDPDAAHYRLLDKFDGCKDRIPPGILPIASDDFGNLILIAIGAKSVGAIYFCDHENENPDGDPWWDNISYISPSFTDFVNSLH